jgi:site-specific recombinase XerD
MVVHRQTITPFDPESTSWLNFLVQAGASASTIDSYARDLRDFAVVLESRDVAEIARLDQSTIENISEFWIASGAASSTVYRRFACLRSFARFLSRECTYDCSKLLSSRFPPCGRAWREPIAKESIEMILSSSASECDDAWTRTRDCAAIHVAASSGLTTAELVGLNQRDLKPKLSAVVVRSSHLEGRPAVLSDQASYWLSRYLDDVPFNLGPDDPLFVTTHRSRLSARSLQVGFRRFRDLAGVSRPAVLSSLRNAIGFDLAKSGAAPEVLAATLGISVASAWRYCETKETL